MGKTYFLFGVHNHQPVGNFGHVFEMAYEKCYHPFLSILSEFPKIKCSVHTSGPLYDWCQATGKEYVPMLKTMVGRGQVEIMSGGYYEPVLPIISDEDKQGQLQLMNEFIKKEFKQTPQGMWLAERVWEPCLASVINKAGLQYTFLDDTHFRYAGLQEEEFFGYYTTEDVGRPLFIFPISKALRYKIPFSQAQESIDLLASYARQGDVLVTLFDDGEKFGLWPDTYDWIYTKGWLRTFFGLLQERGDIETILPSEAVELFASNGLAYLPTASYEEMGEWVLSAESKAVYDSCEKYLKDNNLFDSYSGFIRGGFFRNFMTKYPRLNYMHKRMLSLSRKIHATTTPGKDKAIFADLWKSQTNCGYWHGIFGGFYLGHIRESVFARLMAAENALDNNYGKQGVTVETEDIDLDGNDEIIVKNDHLRCCFSVQGGSLLELTLRKSPWNLLDTITRQEESYHAKIRDHVTQQAAGVTIHDRVVQKEDNLDQFLQYDTYQRLMLVDHILDKNITLHDFNAGRGITTLANTVYEPTIKQGKAQVTLSFAHDEDPGVFTKKICVGTSCGFAVEYSFSPEVKKRLKDLSFGIEFNLYLPSPKDIFVREGKRRVSLTEAKEWKDARSLIIEDTFKKKTIHFECDQAHIMAMPLYSVSSSESGFERGYQQLVVVFCVKPQEQFKLKFSVT